MADNNIGAYTLEGAACILILTIAHKIYKMSCNSSSNCCGDAIHIDTHNSGEGQSARHVENPQNNV
tara:strand:- start:1163 stop:1360 length:198 start_codon:yes stop_codon:yes gene_type:complete